MNEQDKNAEEYNKQLLKRIAVTFSMEGMSKDLKYFIQKKVSHNKTNLIYLTQILELALNCDEVSESVFKKGSTLKNFFDHVYGEIVKTDELINKAIEMVFEKDVRTKVSKE